MKDAWSTSRNRQPRRPQPPASAAEGSWRRARRPHSSVRDPVPAVLPCSAHPIISPVCGLSPLRAARSRWAACICSSARMPPPKSSSRGTPLIRYTSAGHGGHPDLRLHQVDLVVCGHEHHYERSHPVRGTQDSETKMPIPLSTRAGVIDTSKGTVHLVIGGGGTSTPSNTLFFPQPRCRVFTGAGPFDPAIRRKAQICVVEEAPW
jgi:hypothetical protein